MKQESNRQRTMEDIDGGLHPAVDGQSPGEGETGKQQRTMEDIDGGLHPAVDGQSLGEGETGNQQTDDNGRH